MSNAFKTLNGYEVKDETARTDIGDLESIKDVVTPEFVEAWTETEKYDLANISKALHKLILDVRDTPVETYVDNTVILEGSMTLEANTEENRANNQCHHTTINIEYPEGFNINNAWCLDFQTVSYGGTNIASQYLDGSIIDIRYMSGNLPKSIEFCSDKIILRIGNFETTSWDVNYRILLMKRGGMMYDYSNM